MELARQLALTTLESALPLVLVFLGIYMVFRLLGDFDLTIEGAFTMGAAITAKLILGGHDTVTSMLISVMAGCLAGLGTALLHTRLRMSLLLSGIISMTALFTVNLRIQGQPNLSLLGERTLFSTFDGLPFDIRVAAVIAVSLGFVLVALTGLIYFLHTEYGLGLRSTGMNQEMARSVGVNTDAVTTVAVVVSNGLAGLGGSLAAQIQGFSDAQMGLGIVVAGIASILIGGILVPRSSRVTAGIISVLVGAIVYRFILVYALRLGLQPYDLKGFTALILIAALAAPRVRRGVSSLLRRIPGMTDNGKDAAASRQDPVHFPAKGPGGGPSTGLDGDRIDRAEEPNADRLRQGVDHRAEEGT